MIVLHLKLFIDLMLPAWVINLIASHFSFSPLLPSFFFSFPSLISFLFVCVVPSQLPFGALDECWMRRIVSIHRRWLGWCGARDWKAIPSKLKLGSINDSSWWNKLEPHHQQDDDASHRPAHCFSSTGRYRIYPHTSVLTATVVQKIGTYVFNKSLYIWDHACYIYLCFRGCCCRYDRHGIESCVHPSALASR